HLLRRVTGRGVLFNLATRDMNLLALQNHLLGAAALGIPNVVVLRGDDFSRRDQSLVQAVHGVTPTRLIASVVQLGAGTEFRGGSLASAPTLCVGATLDLSRGIEAEARLTSRK